MSDINKLKEIVSQFIGDIENVTVEPLGKGHINDSFKVVDNTLQYIFVITIHYLK